MEDPIVADKPLLLDIDDVMAELSVGRSTVFGLISSGQLRSVKVGRRRLIPATSLLDFVAELDKVTVAEAGE
jgi:excisionase family DNA binding protein